MLLSAGCATLVPSNRPGGPTTFQVDFYVPGSNAWSTNCPASAPCTPAVEARLFAWHGSLRGRVTNSAGQPVGAGEMVAAYKLGASSVHRTVTTDAQGYYDFTATDAAILLNLDPDVCSWCKPFVAGFVPLAPDNHWGLALDAAFIHAAASRYYIAVAGSTAGMPRPPDARNARLAFLRSSHLTNLDLSNSSCKLLPLTPITDPDAQYFEAHNGNIYDFDHLTPPMQAAVLCFGEAVAAANGTFVPLSGWRPAAYQAHLREVWFRWWQLQNLSAAERAECTELVAALTAEWSTHGLAARPAATSRHTQGEALDAQVNVSTAPDPLAAGCGLRRSLPTVDPDHYVLN